MAARGGAVHTGVNIGAIEQVGTQFRLQAGEQQHGPFDAVVVASGAPSTASLLAPLGETDLATMLDQFTYEPITTVYLQYAASTVLDLPFYALADRAEIGHWGQFVFDRGQLDAAQAGLFAVVISTAAAAAEMDRKDLAAAVAAQLAAVLGKAECAAPVWTQVITEKRATFACTPGLVRPATATSIAGLAMAGDFTAGDYPATLESAVRSGVQAAAHVAKAVTH